MAGRNGYVAAAATQVTVGVVAHAAAEGCLPDLVTGAVIAGVALVSLRAAARLLPRGNPLIKVTVGQLLVHAVFALFARCGDHGHDHAPVTADSAMTAWSDHALMVPAHLVAVVLALSVARRVEAAVARAVRYVIDRGLPGAMLGLPRTAPVAFVPAAAIERPATAAWLASSVTRRGPPRPPRPA